MPKRAAARTSTKALPTISPKDSASHVPDEAVQNIQPASPGKLLHLQRTIGNRAMTHLLSPSMSAKGSSSPRIQREVMSYGKFVEISGQNKSPELAKVFSGEKGRDDLNETRQKAGSPQKFSEDYAQGTNINRAMAELEFSRKHGNPEEIMLNLWKLHNAIQYWQTMYAASPEAASHKILLDTLSGSIRDEVNKLTKDKNKAASAGEGGETNALSKGLKKFGKMGKKTVGSLKEKAIKGRNLEFQETDFMDEADAFGLSPDMKELKAAGVPIDYILQYFMAVDGDSADEKEKKALRQSTISMVLNLLASKRAEMMSYIEDAFADLEATGLPSVYMLKAIIYSRFGIVMEKILGTDRDQAIGQPLTKQEEDAIRTYSGGAYGAINKEARAAKAGKDDAAQPKAHGSIMELLVSGLNKLPKYEGLAYRGLLKPPPGFEQYATEGGETADLGFSSATPALSAVYNFFEAYPNNPSNTIFMMQCKTASNIINYSVNPQEGEILFRPGTRFRINKIWTHDANGNIPDDAPAEVKMILHARGEARNRVGEEFVPGQHKEFINGKDGTKIQNRFQNRVLILSEV
ncbi:MAG: ADP-ribosyltransferase [Pleurocapsa minor GSE-CHR-MK-17-07R]|jgi:hypothetical protein|nr:ADP-ribosyltransferase [Pleurocapsa minor GSE-CHR-MK 17-07R]